MDNKLGREIRPKSCGLDSNESNSVEIRVKSDTLLVINLPDSRARRIMLKSVLFAMVLLALPSMCYVLRKTSTNVTLYEHNGLDNEDGIKILPILLRNLVEEGLIKKGHRGFVAGAAIGDIENDFEIVREAGIILLTEANLKNEDARQAFDFVFDKRLQHLPAIDGLLKNNGLVIAPLGRDPSSGLRLLSSYKIVYLRRFESTVVAMRKIGPYMARNSKEVLCGVTTEEKRDALKGLEDVYLEPPRRAALELKKPRFTSRKIKFLPDLLKDTLDEYPRRVFISEDSGAVDWFYKNYPMRNQEFEVYNVEVGVNSNDGSFQEMGVSNWMAEKVKREDYVVMKAEAQVVEEMLKDKTLCLIDELFLECKNQWVDTEEENVSKRAYWECLTLYGKVKDEGIAVHQWWD